MTESSETKVAILEERMRRLQDDMREVNNEITSLRNELRTLTEGSLRFQAQTKLVGFLGSAAAVLITAADRVLGWLR